MEESSVPFNLRSFASFARGKKMALAFTSAILTRSKSCYAFASAASTSSILAFCCKKSMTFSLRSWLQIS